MVWLHNFNQMFAQHPVIVTLIIIVIIIEIMR